MIKYDKQLGLLEIEFGDHLKAGGRRYEIEAYRNNGTFRIGAWWDYRKYHYFEITFHLFILDIKFCKWSSQWKKLDDK